MGVDGRVGGALLAIADGVPAPGLVQATLETAHWAGNQLARWVGVVVLFVNALGQLTFASEYPIWSLTIFGLDVLAVYALVVHAGRAVARE